MKLKTAFFYFAFSALFCFVLADRSFYNLSGDNLNLASLIYPRAFPEFYGNDIVKINPGAYYLPSFLEPALWLLRLTGSYIRVLQIIMLAQMTATLITTHILLNGLFSGADELKKALMTMLMVMTVVYMPSGEMTGFGGGLISAIPRFTFGAVLPLLILLYYKRAFVSVRNVRIPVIIPVGALCGLLINIHPPSAINTFAVLAAHWLIFKAEGPLLRRAVTLALSGVCFAALSLSYVAPYVANVYGKPASELRVAPAAPLPGAPAPATAPAETKPKSAIAKLIPYIRLPGTEDYIFWLKQALFLPFAAVFFVITILRRRIVTPELAGREAYIFLSSLFLTAFIIDLAGVILNPLVRFGPFLQAFQRADRLVFTIIELLALWFLVNGAKCGLRKAEWLTLSAGILFFWITLSATKASFQYEILSPLKKLTWMPLDRQTLVVNAVIAAVILAAVLLFALNRSRAELSRRTLIVCLALTAFLWPLMSGGPLVAASTAMNTLNGMGTWTVAAKFTKSKAAEKIAAYDDISAWIRQNTPATVRIFTLDNDRAQNLKLSGLRSGCGKFDEIGFADLSVDIDKFYADAQSQEPEAAARTARLLDRLGISLILASKEIDFGPLKKSAGLSPLYENKYFIILTRKQHEAK